MAEMESLQRTILTSLVAAASVFKAGSFCLSKQLVQTNQNKLSETSFQLIALKKNQELTSVSRNLHTLT